MTTLMKVTVEIPFNWPFSAPCSSLCPSLEYYFHTHARLERIRKVESSALISYIETTIVLKFTGKSR